MHEYAVTKNIIDTVFNVAQENKIKKIKSITLVIGELSSIIDESVQLYFDILSENTPLYGAKLIFKKVSAILFCKACNSQFPKNNGFICPKCGGDAFLKKGTGNEFYIERIEY